MNIDQNSIVKDVVNAHPKTSDIFKKHGIDFCCGGNTAIKNAAEQKSIAPETVLDEINACIAIEMNRNDRPEVWTDSSSEELIRHIQNHYHRTLEEELAQLSPYVTKVARVHGEHRPELKKVYSLFYELKQDLLEHTKKEDNEVFPLLLSISSNDSNIPNEALASILELEKEHQHAGQLLSELRAVTSGYTPPLDACGTFRLVYKRLEQLEEQTFMHIHLENNILLPRYEKSAS